MDPLLAPAVLVPIAIGSVWATSHFGACPKNDGLLEAEFVTAVTATEAETRQRGAGNSGDFLPPSPPAKKFTEFPR